MSTRRKTEEGFIQATSENIPAVDVEMLHEFYMENPDYAVGESTGEKNRRAMRADYAGDAVGFVSLRRQGGTCTVKAKVTPEHRVRADGYDVEVVIDESASRIQSCKCFDCAASEGGCKHALAVLSFLLRNSCSPSVTEVECYWKQSRLAASVKYGEVLVASEIASSAHRPSSQPSGSSSSQLLEAFGARPGTSSLSITLNPDLATQPVSLHQLAIRFKQSGTAIEAENFLSFIRGNIGESQYRSAELASKDQTASRVWHELRYGRITASYVYQASRCKAADGTLIEAIMGAYSFPETEAMARGKRLESQVLEAAIGKWRTSGLIISRELPCIGASPDGVLDDAVLEVKCPAKATTVKNYLTPQGALQPKAMAQIQLQMKVAGKTKGIFIVADPDFEKNGNFTKIAVDYSPQFIDPVVADALKFWSEHIFPKIMRCT